MQPKFLNIDLILTCILFGDVLKSSIFKKKTHNGQNWDLVSWFRQITTAQLMFCGMMVIAQNREF